MNYNSKEIKNRRSLSSYNAKPKWYEPIIDFMIIWVVMAGAFSFIYIVTTFTLYFFSITNLGIHVYLLPTPIIAFVLYILYKRSKT